MIEQQRSARSMGVAMRIRDVRIAVVCAALLVGACGGDGSGEATPSTPTSTTTTAPSGARPGTTSPGGEARAEEEIVRLTTPRSELPDLPPDDELVAIAARTPESHRRSVHGGGWMTDDFGSWFSGAEPIMSDDGTSVLAIYVSGLGRVPRDVYDDRSVDLEQLARERLGPDEYQRRIDSLRETQRCLREDRPNCLGRES